YKGFGIDDLCDDDCRVFPFMQAVYSQVSRMYFILSAKRLDYGLDRSMREEMIQAWMKELAQFKDHPAMMAMHSHAVSTGNFNSAFLRIAVEVLGDVSAHRPDGGIEKTPALGETQALSPPT